MRTSQVTVCASNVGGGVAELLAALEPSDAVALARIAERMRELAALLVAPPPNPYAVREERAATPPGNAQPPAEQAPPPGEWSEPPGLLRAVLTDLSRGPGAPWAVARRIDRSKRDVEALLAARPDLFEPRPSGRAAVELSAAGRAALAELVGADSTAERPSPTPAD